MYWNDLALVVPTFSTSALFKCVYAEWWVLLHTVNEIMMISLSEPWKVYGVPQTILNCFIASYGIWSLMSELIYFTWLLKGAIIPIVGTSS